MYAFNIEDISNRLYENCRA